MKASKSKAKINNDSAKLTRTKKVALTKSPNLFPVVGIGASAGGLEAFRKLIKAIPENSGMAFVLVQHLDPNHESLLPELLQKVTGIPVLEITNEIKVEPNHIYIIPSNKMLIANDGVLKLSPRPSKSKTERNLSIDHFFTSLAEVHQSHAIGVVLSGTASDGTAGLKSIKDHGGITFAQDEASAAFEGMPHSAAQAGVVDFILPPEEIPQKLIEVARHINGNHLEMPDLTPSAEEAFKQILLLLRMRKGTDFTYYKQPTIQRRILRRMALNKKEEPVDYLKYVRENKAEQDILYQDLLIPVTSFFRDPKIFDQLSETAFPFIIKNKTAGEPIRIWVAGCSTGEEAYSIAISLKEFLGDNQRVQIFSTDISEPAIAKARAGVYTKSEVHTVSAKRLNDFFTKTNNQYQVNKQIRDMCVFANHNFIKDPPFRKIDLVSCRNVLIYMESYLQKKAFTTFHYALNPKGFLLLGKTESTISVPDLFASASKNDKLFSRKDGPGRFVYTSSLRSEKNFNPSNGSPKQEVTTDFQKTADDIMLSKYTPAGVIINESLDIIHFRGSTTKFLEQTPGKPSHNLLKMAKNGLAFELRNLVHKAKKSKDTVSKENILVQINGTSHTIAIEVIPLPNTPEPYYLILFHDRLPTGKRKTVVPTKKTSKSQAGHEAKDLRILQLENELAQIYEDIRSIAEDQEAANEELQTDNEELLSGSEELQSMNEELETSKEELQSTNEELTVVNQEIISLNEQVSEARYYAEAIVATVREPLLVLDKNLRVVTANSSFYKSFRTNQSETEGNLLYTLGNKEWDIPALRTVLENILPQKLLLQDFEITQTFAAIGERVMLLNASELIKENGTEKLILLAIEDITERVMTQKKMEAQAIMVQNLLMNAPAHIATLTGPTHIYEVVNEHYQQLFGSRQLKGKPLLEALPELKGQGFDTLLDHVYNTGEPYVGIDIPITLARDQDKTPELLYFNFSYQPIYDENKRIYSILVFGYEVTAQVIAKNNNKITEQLHTKEMEDKVQMRTLELSEANELLLKKNVELGNMNNELHSFSYVASHDLQEPLRKIQTFSKRILEKENENLSENGKDYFHRMQNAAKRMQTLIEDLLAFSRVNTGERKFENTDLNKIISEVKNDLKESIEETSAIIETKELCTVHIIPFQFRQLMQNLLSNALKFSRPDVAPHIIISSEIINGETL